MLPTFRTNLRAKLVRTMVAMLLTVATATLLVVAGMNYVTSRVTLSTIESHLRDNITRKGSDLVTGQALALRDLVADNAFGDVARLIERTAQRDSETVYGLFLGDDLKPWGYTWRGQHEGRTTRPDWTDLQIDAASLRSPGVRVTTRHLFGQTVFEFATSVVDDKGSFLGSLRYAISDQSLQQALADAHAASRRALLTTVLLLVLLGGAATALGVLLSRRAAARITLPVGDLTNAVNTLASGRRDIRVAIDSGDEIQLLGEAFNKMAAELQDHTRHLEEMNRALEGKVAERTREVGDRNRDMRLVLDNVEQGFLTLSPSGHLAQERSAIVDRWFGSYGPDTRFVDYMARVDTGFSDSFALGYEALLEAFLPRELCLDQLPSRIRRNSREFRCTYSPLGTEEQPAGLLVVINDVTSELLAARREAERGEILAMFEALTRDRAGFLAFMDEASEQVMRLSSGDLDEQKRVLHTLKGNSGVMGLGVVAALCANLEEEIADIRAPASRAILEPLERRWIELTQTLRTFLGEKGRDVIELSAREIERLDEEIRAGATPGRIQDRLASWKLEPVERSLARLGNHARALAARFNKGDLVVVTDGGGVRLAPHAWAGFWSDLVHVVRNAVDHGFEQPAVRQAAGKSARPHLRLAAYLSGRKLIIEAEDDGAGIDWAAVRRAAARRGLPHETEDDLVRAIFTTEVTTRAEVSTLSGRGVGLAAVRKQVEELGGSIVVQSQLGAGTCFRFTFPLPEVGPRFGVEVGEDAPGPRPDLVVS